MKKREHSPKCSLSTQGKGTKKAGKGTFFLKKNKLRGIFYVNSNSLVLTFRTYLELKN